MSSASVDQVTIEVTWLLSCRKESFLGPNVQCGDYIYGINSQRIMSTQTEILSKHVLVCVYVCLLLENRCNRELYDSPIGIQSLKGKKWES